VLLEGLSTDAGSAVFLDRGTILGTKMIPTLTTHTHRIATGSHGNADLDLECFFFIESVISFMVIAIQACAK